MSSAKKVLWTMTAGIVAGAVLGILYAPAGGAETRRRISKLKQKLGCCCGSCDVDEDKETLEELSRNLHDELEKINKKLESM
jgi:gas vesicle protein